MRKLFQIDRRESVAECGAYQPSSYPSYHHAYQHSYQQDYAPAHEVYELPDQLAVVAQRSDIRFTRAMAPPGRYQGEVASASDYEALREENNLSSAVAFSGVALDMLDAESIEGAEKEEGGGPPTGRSNAGADSSINKLDSHLLFTSIPGQGSDDRMSATLNAPFSPPGPISVSTKPEQVVMSPVRIGPDIRDLQLQPIIPTPTKEIIPREISKTLESTDRVIQPNGVDVRATKRQGNKEKVRAPNMFCCF